ncbi:hypothetical protein ACSHT0_07595 [Tepidicaulis sp. LMO-SS28]|uniref:hypothetical protein n=1 Tax=Tepidicaulis sp. LMO-SS28 TaxID=3447455 RepID=UPI003EE133D4
MSDRLYRFRTLERLVNKGELEKQEIFFASPETLNDPMEGFRDFFWLGDAVIWGNLFRHYILCLDHVFVHSLVAGESYSISRNDIPVFNIDDDHKTQQLVDRKSKLADEFLHHALIMRLIEFLKNKSTPTRREELSIYLRMAHPIALLTIQKINIDSGLTTYEKTSGRENALLESMMKHATQTIDKIAQIEATSTSNEASDLITKLFRAQHEIESDVRFIHLYSQDEKSLSPNKNFVLIEFPSEYIIQIEKLAHPSWFTACFMEECHDSSVWGHYGDSHTAACLIFRTEPVNGIKTLRLTMPVGLGNNGIIKRTTLLQFHKVTYESKHQPIDFFRSLGVSPIPSVLKTWYTNLAGERSECGTHIFDREQQSEWRSRYWADLYSSLTRKLEAWRNEQEQRLISTSDLLDLSAPSSRIVHYDFSDLEGIIFGIKTPMDMKARICEIIEDKCRHEGRKDFKFFQAFYSSETGRIEHREMSLLKFNSF